MVTFLAGVLSASVLVALLLILVRSRRKRVMWLLLMLVGSLWMFYITSNGWLLG